MVRISTYEKILNLIRLYGSPLNAYEEGVITYSTYYKYNSITMTKEFVKWWNSL